MRRFFRALNERDFDRVAGSVAETCEYVSMPSGAVARGYAEILAGLRSFAGAFPDWHVEIESLIASDPYVVVEWRVSGTHEGEFRGHPATGRRFERRGCSVAEISGGKIRRYRDYFDRMTLLEQLGLAVVL